jgi:hypothetical protein
MVGIRYDFVVSTDLPKFPCESRARILTVDGSREGPADHFAIAQYRHADTGAGIDRVLGAGFTLNEVTATVCGGSSRKSRVRSSLIRWPSFPIAIATQEAVDGFYSNSDRARRLVLVQIFEAKIRRPVCSMMLSIAP